MWIKIVKNILKRTPWTNWNTNHNIDNNTKRQVKCRIYKKEVMSEKITFAYPRNEEWWRSRWRLEKAKVVIGKVNELLKHIPTDVINELNELIYAGSKLDSYKIIIFRRNPNRNRKTVWKNEARRTNKRTATSNCKRRKTYRNLTKKDPKKTTTFLSDNTRGINK